jgi:hypothetical protein
VLHPRIQVLEEDGVVVEDHLPVPSIQRERETHMTHDTVRTSTLEKMAFTSARVMNGFCDFAIFVSGFKNFCRGCQNTFGSLQGRHSGEGRERERERERTLMITARLRT